MRYNTVLFLSRIAILCAVFCSCSKKTASVPPKIPFTYTVSGLPDITVPQFLDTTLYVKLTVSTASGTSDSVTLLPTTIPGGVTFLPSAGTGLPGFSGIFTMKVHINSPGSFPVSIRTSSPSGDTQYHTFNIVVVSDTFCTLAMAGVYTATTTFYFYANRYPPFTETENNVDVTGTRSAISVPLNSLVGLPVDFDINLNCEAGTLVSKGYDADDYYAGPVSGTFTNNTIILNYYYNQMAAGDFYGNCQTILTR